MTDPLAEDLARKQASAGRDDLADDLARKTRTQAQWEQTPQYARLKAKHAETMGKLGKLQADDSGPSVGELGSDFLKGVNSVATDEMNAATFGLFGRARDAIGGRLAPESLATAKANEAEVRQTPGYGVMSGVGQAGAAGLGGPGKLYQGVQSLVGAGKPILTGALSGGVTGATQRAVGGAGKEAPLDTAVGAGVSGLAGAGVGAGFGAVAKYVGGAPARKAESELAGLKEGVQYKTRIQKFQPNEEQLRVALEERPDARALAKVDPVAAKPVFDKIVAEKSNQLLNPIYERMQQTGQDGIPIDTIRRQLLAARAGFNKFSEGSAIKNVDSLIGALEEHAAQNGGVIPAQMVRETATSFGNQGFENLPNFGAGSIGKQLKQDVSAALRESIGDHVEALAAGPGGKALRGAFEQADREVSIWMRARDIVAEKAQRVAGNAAPMGDMVTGAVHAMKHPWMTAAKLVANKAPDIIDRRVLGPAVASPVGRALAPVGQAATIAGAPLTANPLVRAAQEQQRKRKEMAARWMGR